MKTPFNTIEDFLVDDSFVIWALQLNDKEAQKWEDYINRHPDQKENILQAKAFLIKLHGQRITPFDKEISSDKIESIWNRIQYFDKVPQRKNFGHVIRRIAAMITILISLSGAIYLFYDLNTDHIRLSGTQIPLSVNPDKIQLILGDGSIVSLEDEKGKEIISGNEFSAKMLDNKTLKYESKIYEPQEVKYNTAIVPRGRKISIVLSDGTKVWLNSCSEFRYPTIFDGKDRKVELIKGEALFDVKTNKKNPFIVETTDISVRALGTTFNICAYEKDTIKTVLVEGNVHMYRNTQPYSKETSIHIQPNQKASYYKSGDNIMLENVDSYIHTSWKDGVLIFKNKSFRDLLKKIERWYDVDITLANEELYNLHFTGVIREGKTIEHILTLIKSTSPVNYTIEGQKVYIEREKEI